MSYLDRKISEQTKIPGLGVLAAADGLRELDKSSDSLHVSGKGGVEGILSTGDGKLEFICFASQTLAYVKSLSGYPAYYPLRDVSMDEPVKAVLMDLDGTTVNSEQFWVWIIERTVAFFRGDNLFTLEPEDIPFVSGHSTTEHLQYCIGKYLSGVAIEEVRARYFTIFRHEMAEIAAGRGRPDAFTPSRGIKEFLLRLKESKIKIALVTSGLYEKAMPEILAAFKTLGLGAPEDFYDSIITAGFQPGHNNYGTIGELSPKPHPWLYAESAVVGLGLSFEQRGTIVGIDDSAAGVCSVRLAGFSAIGVGGGNIAHAGTKALCTHFCEGFDDVSDLLFG
jgi:beta-phosphoglucomutase-like phosphatase (HAD superfamily)